jgi:hypothetical protein
MESDRRQITIQILVFSFASSKPPLGGGGNYALPLKETMRLQHWESQAQVSTWTLSKVKLKQFNLDDGILNS